MASQVLMSSRFLDEEYSDNGYSCIATFMVILMQYSTAFWCNIFKELGMIRCLVYTLQSVAI